MKFNKKIVYLIIVALVVSGAGVFYIVTNSTNYQSLIPPQLQEYAPFDQEKTTTFEELPQYNPPQNTPQYTQQVLHNVPFAAQAPFGEWEDPRQQDGCEEIASLMAVKWARGESLSLQEAKDAIIAISDWEQQNYGSFHDSSAQDTTDRILKGYLQYDKVELVYNISVEDIKRELYAGNVVIIPTNGKALGNPYFTAGGPDRHMLPVIGYDPSSKEFITNDNGTRHGAGWRYHENVLQNALRDYATGYKEPIPQPTVTAMTVVKK